MNSAKIAPELLLLFQDYKVGRHADWAQYSGILSVQSDIDNSKPPRVNVFLHCDAAEFDYLEGVGVRLNTRKGRVRTASLPLESLDRLSEEPNITYIGASHLLHPLMDVAPGAVQLPEFQNRTGLTGEGVIIGVIDTGIDARHPAFEGRILRIWDQTLSPGPIPYGQELTGEGLTGSHDTDGHGTHVAGIAAGADATFGGVAPGSDLIIVKSTRLDTDITEGIRYIFDIADVLGLPAVVNISLGGHFDPHDGTDSLSESIDELSGEGRIVCCAAGNEGNDDIHAQTHLSRYGDPHAISILVPETPEENPLREVVLNGWYSEKDRIEIAVESPSGDSTGYQNILPNDVDIPIWDLPDACIHIATYPSNGLNGDRQFWITLRPPQGSDQRITAGTWHLWLRSRNIEVGQVDVWILNSSPFHARFIGESVSDSLKIGAPGAARRAITVASYTTKVEWRDIDGCLRKNSHPLNDISNFSSEGPLRNRVQKPDVTAPGSFIVSCLSRDADPARDLQINENYIAMQGTSMSTPFISGIVALLLQHHPRLTPERIKVLLQISSSIPGHLTGCFHPKWGFGLIDADALADTLVSLTS